MQRKLAVKAYVDAGHVHVPDNGYRFMERNDPGYTEDQMNNTGRIEMVKILHPDFDVSLIDNP